MANGLAALLAGLFLIAVAIKGNSSALVDKLGEEKGFIPWAIALVMVWLLKGALEAKGGAYAALGAGLIALVFVGLFLQAGAQGFANFDAVMAKLKG